MNECRARQPSSDEFQFILENADTAMVVDCTPGHIHATFDFALKCARRGGEEGRGVAGASAGRRGVVCVRLCLCLGLFPARATTFGVGDAEVSISGVVSAGTSIRTQSPNPAFITRANGADAGVPGIAPAGRNQDDGNLNYRRGDPVSRPESTPVWPGEASRYVQRAKNPGVRTRDSRLPGRHVLRNFGPDDPSMEPGVASPTALIFQNCLLCEICGGPGRTQTCNQTGLSLSPPSDAKHLLPRKQGL
jgi:uncharacterized protein DUF1302